MAENRRIGKYEVESKIGAGGFATVYRAIDTTLGRPVAIKALHPPLLIDRNFVERFFREARMMAQMRHQNILSIYEVDQVGGRVFLSAELAEGGSLADRLAQGRLPWAQFLATLGPIAEALDYAHGQGIVHRDLKPANILLSGDGRPMISDFGFAKVASESSASMSASSGILGTPAYIAPEVWDENAATPAADLYALGCIAYEMLTGQQLFGGVTPVQALASHIRGPQLPAAWPADVPPGVSDVLRRALAKDPAERYPSARAFAQALTALRPAAQVAPTPPAKVERPRPAPERPAALVTVEKAASASEPAPRAAAQPQTLGPTPAPAARQGGAGPFWGPVAILVAGEIVALVIPVALQGSPSVSMTTGLVSGAIWGVFTSIALRRVIPGFSMAQRLALVGCWGLCLGLSSAFSGLTAYLCMLIGLIGTGLIVRWAQPAFAWWRILISVVGWLLGAGGVGAVALGLFLAALSMSSGSSSSEAMWIIGPVGLAAVLLALALPNAILIDQIRRARRAAATR